MAEAVAGTAVLRESGVNKNLEGDNAIAVFEGLLTIPPTDRGTHFVGITVLSNITKTSTAWTPAAGAEIIAIVSVNVRIATGTGTGSIPVPTDTWGDTGGTAWAAVPGTFANRGSATVGQYMENLQAFTRKIGTGPVSGTMTCTALDPGGANQSNDGWFGFHAWEKSNPHASPVGLGTNTVSTNATCVTDLGSAPAVTSDVYGMMQCDNELVTPTVTGLTIDDTQSPSANVITMSWGHTGAPTQTQTWAGVASGQRHLAVAVEIKSA